MILDNYDKHRQLERTVNYENVNIPLQEYRITFHVAETLESVYGEDPYWCYIYAASEDDALDYFNKTHDGLALTITYIDVIDDV